MHNDGRDVLVEGGLDVDGLALNESRGSYVL